MSVNNTGDTFIPTYNTCDDVSPQCPVEATIYGNYFTTIACVFFVAIYTVCLLTQVYFGYLSKAWSFAVWLGIGTFFELAGYGARTIMSKNPWNFNAFLVQNMTLILGPTLIAAAISITFKHLVVWYGAEHSWLRPSLYPWVFVGTDMISILVQSAGGGLSAMSSEDPAMMDVANTMLIGGTVFQVVNMSLCGGLMLHFLWRRRRANRGRSRLGSMGHESMAQLTPEGHAKTGDRAFSNPRAEYRVSTFVRAIACAYIAILIRCIYRIPEMAMGWGSSLMQNETVFLLFDGTMMLLSVVLLTAFHPFHLFPFLGQKEQHKTAGHMLNDLS
ncbi:hypothetical protein ACHAQA_003874 [Verticillium albo-atrum]